MRSGVLFISPSSEDANGLREMLGPLEIPVQHARDLRRARQRLDQEAYGVVLTEARLPDGSWEDVLELVAAEQSRSTVVVTHPFADARFWADALDHGAYDVVTQPFCCAEVQRILSNALSSPPDLRRAANAAV